MPELPEVETARRRAERALRGRRIAAVAVRPDPIIFEGVSPRRLASALRGARVIGTGRKGKYFWLELDRRPWPLFHFGMSGGMETLSRGQRRSRFWKLELATGEGTRVVWEDARRLGRIRLRHDPASEPPISRLGFDALRELPDTASLRRALAGRRTAVKALLLDQSFSAGVGNWIADEVLFQAGIAPHRRADELGSTEIRRLRRSLEAVIQHAVRVRADDSRFPPGWLFHYRWGRDRDARLPRGHRLAFTTIGGRTTAWVPARQR